MNYTVRGRQGKLVLNGQTVRKMLFSNDVRNAMIEVAEPIARRAGEDHSVEYFNGHDRVRIIVKTDSEKSARSNAENNTLLKAVGK